MGYRCPVCADPQADGHHLANHLAFTAILGDDGHRAWLDEHAPAWADADPDGLAETVSDHADETEFHQAFEDAIGDAGGHDGGHDRDHAHGRGRGGASAAGFDSVDGDETDPSTLFDDGDEGADDVLAEARELTRKRRANADDGRPDARDADGDESTVDDDESGGEPGDEPDDGEFENESDGGEPDDEPGDGES